MKIRAMLWMLLALMPMAVYATDQERMPSPNKSWVVYYKDELPASAFEPYDIIVFDREKHPPIRDLKAKGKVILGYISAGELEEYRPDAKHVKANHALLHKNPQWKGHVAVDVRNPEWTRYLIEEVIPPVLQSGFDGIFVDTLDSVEAYELEHPEQYKGMIESAAAMIKAIRYHYPTMKIMINRGFYTMPHIAAEVDYLLGEGTLVKYDFEKGNHRFFEEHIYQEYVDKMHELKRKAPHLELVMLDYWHMDDPDTVKEIYRRHEANGFIPYVTTIALDRVDPRPE
jgi:polysaccharide biosynthesis protein PelA